MNTSNIIAYGIVILLLLAIPYIFYRMIKAILMLRQVVPTNMVHIVQSAKKSTPYGRGKPAGNTYYAWPDWIPIFGINVTRFPESIFQVHLHNYEAYDNARLPFVVDITAFFRVDNAEVVAQRVSHFDELNSQLVSVIQGSVRSILAKNSLEIIMQERASLGKQFTDEVTHQIQEWGVLPVKTIEFMDIRDSAHGNVIANIMAKEKSRIEMESRVRVAENQQVAENKEIDARRMIEVQRQDAEQQIGVRTAEKEKSVGIAKEQANQEVLDASKVTTEKNMDVQRVQEVKAAEIQRDVAVVTAEQKKLQLEIAAMADKNVQITNSEAKKQSTITTAQGDLEASKLTAEGIRVQGEAKGAAEQAVLMAPVQTQITLAKEIGENQGYQQYLVTIKQIEANRDVGIEVSKSFANANMKIIANGGSIGEGVGNLSKMISSSGGTHIASMLEGLTQTDTGKSLIDGVVSKLTNPPKA
jgi:flotillin